MTVSLSAKQVEFLNSILTNNVQRVKKVRTALSDASAAVTDRSHFIIIDTLEKVYCSEEEATEGILSLIKSTNEK